MHRISLSLMALASALSPAALAENQIWTAAGAGAKPFQNKAISLDFDADLRFQPDGDLDTIELRPGMGYRLNDRFKISGGYLWASARRDGPDRIEHRLWQQVSYDFGAAYGLEFDGRSRLEERRREGWNDTGVRLRQKFGVKRPIEGAPFKLSLSTDLYFELNKTDWGQSGGFTEARTEAKIEWDASETVSWEFGYLNQFEYDRSGPDETNHHIVVGVSKDF